MTDTPPTFPVPQNKDEAEAARRALAQHDLTRLEEARAVIDGENLKAAIAEIQAVLEGGLPVGSSAAKNLPRLASWSEDVLRNIDADIEQTGNVANPPPPPNPIEPVPLVPVPETEG